MPANKYNYPVPDPFMALQQQIKALEARLQHVEPGIYPEQWHNVGDPGEPVFLNGWINVVPVGDTYQLVGFMRDANGFIHLRGAASAGTTDTPIFFLPLEYRPIRQQNFIIDTAAGPKRCVVDAAALSGGVFVYSGASNWPVFLDNVRYSIN